jgi:protoheme IX farnesyltransferase
VGAVLGAAGFAWLAVFVNWAAAGLATGALVFYVAVYSLYLKRRTSQNIVIGGAAGAVPTLVGWAAVTGGVALPAWVLFAVIFYWTPPHFWALAIRFEDDYRRAGVPMLPVVAGVAATARQIVLYATLLTGVSLLLYSVAELGWIYLTAAAALGSGFLVEAVRLTRDRDRAMSVFQFSNVYLTLLFAAMALDVLAL